MRGDRLLQELSAHLQAQLRGEDLLARVGGDEFALLFPETGREAAAGTVERLRASVASTPLAQLQITITAGSCCSEHGGASPAALYRCADRALYDGKADGRNCSVAVATD